MNKKIIILVSAVLVFVVSFSVLLDLYLLSGNYVATEQQALDIAIDAYMTEMDISQKESFLKRISQTSDDYRYVEIEEGNTYWIVYFSKDLVNDRNRLNSIYRKGGGGAYAVEISKYFAKIKPTAILLSK